MLRKLALGLTLLVTPALAATPDDLQNAINNVPWNNGMRNLSGGMVQSVFQTTHDVLTNTLSLTGGNLSGATTIGDPACNYNTGTRASDGSASWVPTCTKSFLGTSTLAWPTYSVGGTTYLPDGVTPDPTKNGKALNLVQGVMSSENYAENGLFFNIDVNGGGTNLNGSAQKVMLGGQGRAHNGAGNFWGENIEVTSATSSTPSALFLHNEDDMTFYHFWGTYTGFTGGRWLNIQANGPMGFADFVSGIGNTYSGTVTVSGANFTLAAGDAPMTGDTTTLIIGTNHVRIATRNADAHSGTFQNDGQTLPANGTYSYTWNVHMLNAGFILQGDNLVHDQDMIINTGAETGFYFNGYHHYLLDGRADSAPFILNARDQQKACFSGTTACLFGASGTLYSDSPFFGQKTITGGNSGGGPNAAFLASANTPAFAFFAPGNTTDNKLWDDIVVGNSKTRRLVKDDNSGAYTYEQIDRTGIAPPNVTWNAALFTLNGTVVAAATTNATSTITGALRSSGGFGVAGDSYLGGLLSVTGAITGASLTTAGIGSIGTLKTGTLTATTCTNSGYITIQDATGTARKVMICT